MLGHWRSLSEMNINRHPEQGHALSPPSPQVLGQTDHASQRRQGLAAASTDPGSLHDPALQRTSLWDIPPEPPSPPEWCGPSQEDLLQMEALLEAARATRASELRSPGTTARTIKMSESVGLKRIADTLTAPLHK